MSNYTLEELERAFHTYFRAKTKFLRIAKRYCEQHKVDESQNGKLVLRENAALGESDESTDPQAGAESAPGS